MSVTVTWNGTNYSYPETGDEDWGDQASLAMRAAATSALQKTGGSFTLSAEVDFGSSYGLKSLYYKSRATSGATAGQIRLGNNETIEWLNAASSADLTLKASTANWLQFQSIDLVDLSTTQNISNKNITSSTANISVTAGTMSGINITSGTANLAITGGTIDNVTITSSTALTLKSGTAVNTFPIATSNLATLALTETLTNKTITGATAVNLKSGAAVLTLPVVTDTLASLAGTETLTNKTITGATAVNLKSGAAVVTLPTSTSTLATLALAENLTNKNIGSSTANLAITGGTISGVTLSIGSLTGCVISSSTANISLTGGNVNAYQTNQELITADLPNSSSAYGWNFNETSWSTGGTFVGGQNLTQVGTIQANADVLGTTGLRNGFDGASSYLTNTGTTMKSGTGSLTTYGWIYRASWAGISTDEIILDLRDRSGAASGQNGGFLYLQALNDTLTFYAASGSTLVVQLQETGFTNLAAGWHHLGIVRDAANTLTKLFCDGVKIQEKPILSAMTNSLGHLTLGNRWDNGVIFTGRMDEVVLHIGTAYTDDQIRRIYARSAQRFAHLSQLPGGTTELVITSPTYGAKFPWYGGLYDNGITTAANNTVTVSAEFYVYPNANVEIAGVWTLTTAPTNIDTLATLLMPLNASKTTINNDSLCMFEDNSATKYYYGTATIGMNIAYGVSLYYFTLDTVLYQKATAMADTSAPVTWGNSDSLRVRIRYAYV